jgi:hypothetical protein
LLPAIAPIDRESVAMDLTVLLVAFAVSAALGVGIAWASLTLLFRSLSIGPRDAALEPQRTVNGSISSVRVPSAS